MSGIKEELKNAIPEVAGKVYDDVAHPALEATGQIISFFPRTVRLWLNRWEKWITNGEESLKLTEEALGEKIRKIPEEKLCEPEPYVAVPAIQQIAFCFDSSVLRDMYANLLASSMNIDTKWSVHPGYIDIIKQLTPDEARILSFLHKDLDNYYPLVDLKIDSNGSESYEFVIKNCTNIGEVCEIPDSIHKYIDNLSRLGIIIILEDKYLQDESVYNAIKESEEVQNLKKTTSLKEGQSFSIGKKLFYISDFGKSFINCCIGN